MKRTIKKNTFSIITILILELSLFFLFPHLSAAEETVTDEENADQSNEDVAEITKDYRPKMSITLDANFIINVYIPIKNTQNFTFDGILYDNLENYKETVSASGETYYKVKKELSAPEAATELTLTVNAVFDGKSLIGTFLFSIPRYANAVISSNASEVEKALIADALSYISSAYSYFESEDFSAVSERITEIIGTHPIKHAVSSKDAPANPGLLGAAFVLEATPGIKFYIEESKSADAYAFYVNNKRLSGVTVCEDEGGTYLLVNLKAYELCGPISYTLDGEKAGSFGIHNYYSFVSKNAYTDEKKDELRELLRWLYNYSMSAADYFVYCNSTDAAKESINLNEYAVIYPDNASALIVQKAEKLALSIEERLGVTVSVSSTTGSSKEKSSILIGDSSRMTRDIYVKLSQEASDDAFILDFTGNDVAILGKTEKSTVRAAEYFIENYVNTASGGISALPEGTSVIKPFTVLENGSEIVVEAISTVFGVIPEIYEGGLYPSRLSKSYYPSVIELEHNGENNGKLIAILAVNDNPTAEYKHLDTNSCVMESSDGGKTWKMIARPQETINPTYTAEDGTEYTVQGISMAHIYELPAQVGDMPAGTLLYSGTSVNYNCYSQVSIWRSFDCGYTWEEYTIVATGGKTREGVWEPFTWYEQSDGYLYCFYSDDSDPLHDQKLVFKRSQDGVNWSDAVGVCVFDSQKARPGMLIMTKMDSGEYFCVYEYYGGQSGKIYYKITDDITDWDPASPGTLLEAPDGYVVTGGPSCIWTEAGGECGTLIVSGKADFDGGQRHLLFVSLDYGRSWTTIENPLPYDITLDVKETNRVGHSAAFTVSSDPSVIYYLNTTLTPETGLQRVEFAKLKIYENQ